MNDIKKKYLEIYPFGSAINTLLVSFTTAFATLFFMYQKYTSGVFAQDDPYELNHFKNLHTTLIEKIMQPDENRWRPAANIAYLIVTHIVGESYFKWLVVSATIMAAITSWIFFAYWKQSHNKLSASFVAILFVTSRFSQGIILNYTFILESLSLIILLVLLLKFRKNWDQEFFRGKNTSLVLFCALILSHERYVGLYLFIVAYFLLHNKIDQKTRIRLLIEFSLPVISLFLVKKYVLGIPLFVGTGSTTQVGFSLHTAAQYTIFLIVGILGVNLAQEYLLGFVFQNQSNLFKLVSLMILILTFVLIIKKGKSRQERENSFFSRELLLGAALFCSLAIPVVSTIRLESRWYLPLYVLFLAYLFKDNNMGNQKSKSYLQRTPQISWILVVFVSLNLFMNYGYSQKMNGIYFVSTQNIVKSWLDSLKDVRKNLKEPDAIVYLLDQKNEIDYQALVLAMNANLGIDYLNLKKITKVSEIEGDSSQVVLIGIDASRPDKGFQTLDLNKRT